MYIRCAKCRSSFRLDLTDPTELASCDRCGQDHSLDRVGELGATPHERFVRANEFARSNGIDLASAYSVLLGLIPPDDAPRTEDELVIYPVEEPGASDPAEEESDATGPARYDPGFRPAVKAGLLSYRQALERGDRVRYASRIAQAHGVSMYLAFQVADNRITVREALDRRAEERPRRLSLASITPTAAVMLSAVLSGAIAFWAGYVSRGRDVDQASSTPPAIRVGPAVRAPAVETSTEVRTNRAGQPTFVTGSGPRAVLEAFCGAGGAGRREAVELVPLDDVEQGWIGVYREGGRRFGIRIYRDGRLDRWMAGNGLQPIAPEPVATGAPPIAARRTNASG